MTSSGAAPAENAVKPSQIAEDDDDFRTAAVQHAVIAGSIDEIGDLRGKEPLELGYAFLVLLRQRQLGQPFC